MAIKIIGSFASYLHTIALVVLVFLLAGIFIGAERAFRLLFFCTAKMLINPFQDDLDAIKARIDKAIDEKEKIAGELEEALNRPRNHMNEALDIALKEA